MTIAVQSGVRFTVLDFVNSTKKFNQKLIYIPQKILTQAYSENVEKTLAPHFN